MRVEALMICSLALLVCVCVIPVRCGDGQFYGGSMSYVLEDTENGTQLVTVSLITGWILGRGPCSEGCSKDDIGRSTLATRNERLVNDSDYLGKYTIDFTPPDDENKNIIYPLEDLNPAPFTERVIDVSEHAKYEQEIQTISFLMPNYTDLLDVNFDGSSWRNLTLQGASLDWHFQTRVSVKTRNDTKQTNRCPQTLARPFYRIKLNQTGHIRIAAVDADGDFIKCEAAQWVEGGQISSHLPRNVTIHENCIVEIEATIANGYRDDTWIAVAVSISDHNRMPIIYGNDELVNSKLLLSSTTLQFVVQVLENLITPEFVDPTLEGNHEFIMYADTTWRTDIYALASENTTVDNFTAFGLQQEDFKFSPLQEDPRRERVKQAVMSWQPSTGEIGRHIACVQAIDSTGVESAEQRCFVLYVQADTFNHTTTITPGKPYFVDIPSPDQFVNCKMKATCVIPLYVHSDIEVIEIHVINSFIEEFHIGPIEIVQHKNQTLYKADLFFQHSMHGHEQLCLNAKDKAGTESETACITSEIEPPDPCKSSPCKNAGVCVSDIMSGGYQCRCTEKFHGRNCEKKHDNCVPTNPCQNGGMCVNYPGMICYCGKPGFTGKYCEININDCEKDSCNYHGSCKDKVNSFECECFGRYTGKNCENDTCPGEDTSLLNCPAANCHRDTCNRNGVCSAGGVCTCSSGYTDTACNTSVCDISGSVTDVEILSPSLQDGSKLTCYMDGNNIMPCKLRIYVATSLGSTPSLSVDTSLNPGIVSLTSALPSNEFPGKSGVYSSDILINGIATNTKDQYVCIHANSGSNPSTPVCLELTLLQDPLKNTKSLQSSQTNARIKFVDPSLKDQSRIICYVGKPCTLQLYTSFKTNQTCDSPVSPGSIESSDNCGSTDIDNDAGRMYSCCEDIITSTPGVTAFPAHARAQACVTEASISITDPGEKDVCFQSGSTNSGTHTLIDYQQVCYTVGVYAANTDPCENSKCQNGGHCFHVGHDDSRCVCQEKYVGEFCEKGPCQPSDDICKNDAYCQIDDGNVTCICKAGYGGLDCSTESVDTQKTVGFPMFTDTARPNEYTCVLYQICSLELIVSGIMGQTPDVAPGTISPSIRLDEINLTSRTSEPNSYLADVRLKATELGLQHVCVQTKDHVNGINRDELCFKVHVISDVQTIYGFMDRPHFVDPSLITNTKVVCPAEKPCHVLYHATTGTGNENKCLDYTTKVSDDFSNYHVYTPCDSCTPGASGTGECMIDVSVATSVDDIGHSRTFCVELALKSSSITGEERCFEVNVISQADANVKTGCQRHQCQNGGFCDSVVPDSPICYCQNGYSGTHCEIAKTQMSFSGSQSLISDFSIPSEVSCLVGKECVIPFKSLTKAGVSPDVSIGYFDARLLVDKPVVHTTTSIPTEHTGYVTISSALEGLYTACLQATTNGKVDDEQCVKVTFIDAGNNNNDIDKTKPYFLLPTLPGDSTVMCQVKTPCHLDMHFTNGDNFEASGKCPNLLDVSSSVLPGLHVFDSMYHSDECNTDVVYVAQTAGEEKTLCLKLSLPGKKGEKRCYKIKVVTDLTNEVVSPCKGTTCSHNGKCIGDPGKSHTSGTCICSPGYYGNQCSQVYNTNENLPGVTDISGLPDGHVHFSNEGAIPELVKCISGEPCCVHVPYHSTGNETPLVGSLGNLLSLSNHSITTDVGSGHHVFIQCVNGTTGSHRLCLQTTTNGTEEGINIDEICMTVDISTGPATQPPKMEPQFTSGGGENGTTVVCKPSTTCHITVVTQANGTKCSQVHECGDGVPGVHIFDTSLVPTDTTCITDVAISTGSAGTDVQLCISAGKDGEEKYLNVKSENKQDFGPCQKKHCINGGKCEATSMSTADCVCPAGYSGTLCETDIDDCAPNPCNNSATCVDGVDEYTCECLPGYNGSHCEIDIDECMSSPCENNGTCTDGVNSYTCSCTPGFTDDNCTTNIDECSPNPCLNGGTCTDGINDYTCHCPPGYSGHMCNTDINECEPEPCENNGTCTDNINSYTCTCEAGFTGANCIINIDDCAPNPCLNGGTCTDGIAGFTCQCPPGYSDHTCSSNINECEPEPCHNNGTCTDGVNGYTCTCEVGFTDINCDMNIDDCTPNPCLNGGTCTDDIDGFTCQCPPGYSDHTCSYNIDDCTPNPCLNGGTCTDDIAGFTCQCPPGYSDFNCSADVDECLSNPCLNGGTCTDDINGYICQCPPGFSGQDCNTNIDDCTPNPCLNGGTCTDGIAGFTCQCPPGYSDQDCNTNIDECTPNPCLNGGTCVDEINGFTCQCPPGYSDQDCNTNIDDCTPNPCLNGGSCVDDIAGFSCQCPPGLSGQDCNTNIDECSPNPCLNGGSCVDEINGYNCQCPPGYSDLNCSADIDECLSNPCLNGGTCTDDINGFTCQCPPGYSGQDCNTNIDDCTPNPCLNGGTCTDDINGYICQCPPGLSGQDCNTNIDECTPNPCLNGGSCVDDIAGYTCQCPPGLSGHDCNTNIDECSPNPCLNGGTCTDDIAGFICQCPPGYSDATCSTEIITTTQSTTTTTTTTTPPKVPGARTHVDVATIYEPMPPAFIEYTIPEIIRCVINKPCSIILPLDGKSFPYPHVQHGHYDPGLSVHPVTVTLKRGLTCETTTTRCAYEATITVVPSEVILYKYCVQTTDNHMINADELCYKIQGVPDSQVTMLSSFVYPPTLPENSTMSCPNEKTCHYQIEVKKNGGHCDLSLVQNSAAVKITEFENKTNTCKYDIAVTPPVGETGDKTYCFKTSSGDVPTCLTVDVKNSALGHEPTCASLHCDNGGFCDSVDGVPSRCLCKPGYSGPVCEHSDACGLSIPETISCTPQDTCKYSFIVTGSKPTVTVDGGGVANIHTSNKSQVVDIEFTTSINASIVCIDVKHGSCDDHTCVTVVYDNSIPKSTTPGGFSSSQLEYVCELQSACYVTTSTRLLGNGKCPSIDVHKDTTVASYHVFDIVKDGAECKSTIAVTGSTTVGEKQTVCLQTETGARQCIGITMKEREAPCTKKHEDTDYVRKMVKTGYASCTCEYNGKTLNVIKRRPVVDPEKLYIAAGFGAGGMIGTVIVGVAIYAIVNKLKSEPKKKRPTPSPKVKQRVHPQKRGAVSLMHI